MIDVERLKQKILDLAIRGQLVPQDPNDEPASVLMEKIRAEKEALIKQGKIKRDKNESYIFKGDDNSYYEKVGKEIKKIVVPFEIPDTWQWIRLNELGLFKKGPFGSALTKDIFVPDSTPKRHKVYEQKNAIQKNWKLGTYYISDEKYKTMSSFVVEPNDIIVSCAGTIGEIYILPDNAEAGIINQALMRIRLYYKPLTDYFLMYFDAVLKQEAAEKGKGTGMKNIPPFDVLKNMLFPLPTYAETNRILDKISNISRYIESIGNATQEISALSEQLKYKILDQFFGDNCRYKSYYEYEEKRLSNITTLITKGSTPTTYGFNYLSEGINFIKVENVKDYSVQHDTIKQYISEAAHEFQKRSQLKKDDLLISIAGTLGRICLIKDEDLPANTNQAFAIVRGYTQSILPDYLKWFITWYVASKSQQLGHGGGMDNLTLSEIKDLIIKFPVNKDEQQQIIDKINAYLEMISVIQGV